MRLVPGADGPAAFKYKLQQVEVDFAPTPDMDATDAAELAAVRDQLRLTYERTFAIDQEMQVGWAHAGVCCSCCLYAFWALCCLHPALSPPPPPPPGLDEGVGGR